jgi:hypothetical protein
MATICIWKGSRRVVLGNDLSDFVNVEFEGEAVGSVEEESNHRGASVVFYRTADGRIVAHKVRWSRWEGECDYGEVYVFPTMNEAAAAFRWEMECAGIIPRQTLTLDEVAGQ